MSTTSSPTASSRDHDVPSAKVVFKNKLCLVSLTRRDGTPMDASSVTEEDIIEICITKGHTHPLGVLCYSTTELVVLFCSTDGLQCTTCGIVKATELRGEAITVKAIAPSEAHTKAYLATLHLNPSNGEGEPHTPRRMTSRSPFQEGEGWAHCSNPLHLQSPSNQLEEAFPLDHHHKHHILLHLVQTWGN